MDTTAVIITLVTVFGGGVGTGFAALWAKCNALSKRCDELSERLRDSEVNLARCEEQHDAVRKEMAQLKEKLTSSSG